MMTTRKHPHEPQEGGSDEPVTASLEDRTAELDSALAEAKDRYLRLAADFENYKKRMRQEQVETIQHASAELINRLLPVLDDLHNVLEHAPQGIDPSWLKGLELSVRKLEDALGTHGLQPIESVGARFDPKLHEAVTTGPADDPGKDDTVGAVLQPGYKLAGMLIRPARVVVLKWRGETDERGRQRGPQGESG